MLRHTLLAAPLLLTAACTPAARYEFVRAAGEAKARCETERTAAAEAVCGADYARGFEEYEAARREAAAPRTAGIDARARR